MTYFRKNIEAMTGYTPGEQPQGDSGAVKLNTNENPYPPSPRVLEVLRRTDWSLLRKYPDPMANKVRDVVARRFGLRREQVLCANGSDELLRMVVTACVGEGEAIAYATPTYSLYPVLAEIQGARAVEVERSEDFSLPAEALLETGARLLFICNPNAPTGTWTEPDAIAALADGFRGVVVVDEAYADFGPGSGLAVLKDKPNVLVLRTLSKSHSLAGLRFGYAVGPEDLIAGLVKVKDSYNCDAVSVEVAAAALEDEAWMQANVEKVRSERARLSEGLARLGFAVLPSEANFVLAAVPDGDAGRWHKALKARRILVRYWNRPRLSDKLRITVGTPEQNDRLLSGIEAVRKEMAA
ncbi:MAG TPA: histidinol-phosphate transaminase [Phycisphaerae bacterium]|nr:histidinol-phosphate transaminase [Phycisphaerae bacterium]